MGARESAQDWRDLLLDLKRRGLDVPPRLAIADGALGFSTFFSRSRSWSSIDMPSLLGRNEATKPNGRQSPRARRPHIIASRSGALAHLLRSNRHLAAFAGSFRVKNHML
ncbi:hypothetical protein GCM10007857_44590 [Bradyrhizobium iriomotense]|uniref:Mutator family transposase n=1 Tax=Bradyrhizobium iriomotense TaxID=441950 RepID=A0ABQ6B0R3_9BRAD|nr:hypothetical protein GCM10007857_44590 [Bradyrhizobium iriomotense]